MSSTEYVLEVRSNNGMAAFPSWQSPSSTCDFLTTGDLQQNMNVVVFIIKAKHLISTNTCTVQIYKINKVA
jgi:hypothetical protein